MYAYTLYIFHAFSCIQLFLLHGYPEHVSLLLLFIYYLCSYLFSYYFYNFIIIIIIISLICFFLNAILHMQEMVNFIRMLLFVI